MASLLNLLQKNIFHKGETILLNHHRMMFKFDMSFSLKEVSIKYKINNIFLIILYTLNKLYIFNNFIYFK